MTQELLIWPFGFFHGDIHLHPLTGELMIEENNWTLLGVEGGVFWQLLRTSSVLGSGL